MTKEFAKNLHEDYLLKEDTYYWLFCGSDNTGLCSCGNCSAMRAEAGGGIYSSGGNGGAFVTGIDKKAITFSTTKPTSINTTGKNRARYTCIKGSLAVPTR